MASRNQKTTRKKTTRKTSRKKTGGGHRPSLEDRLRDEIEKERVREERTLSEGEIQIEISRRAGRPLTLTPEVIEEVCRVLRRGSYLETAAAWIGVTYRCLALWRKRGREEIDRMERAVKAEEMIVQEAESIYVRFFHATEKAIADSDVRDLSNIELHATTNWQASAWRLERRHPGQWGRVFRGDEIEEPTDPDEVSPVVSLVEQMKERRAREEQGA